MFIHVFSVLISPAAPHAYIDPGTGGMLFQMLAVLFASLSAVLFFFSRQIKMFFAGLRRKMSDKDAEEGAAQEGEQSGVEVPDKDENK